MTYVNQDRDIAVDWMRFYQHRWCMLIIVDHQFHHIFTCRCILIWSDMASKSMDGLKAYFTRTRHLSQEIPCFQAKMFPRFNQSCHLRCAVDRRCISQSFQGTLELIFLPGANGIFLKDAIVFWCFHTWKTLAASVFGFHNQFSRYVCTWESTGWCFLRWLTGWSTMVYFGSLW